MSGGTVQPVQVGSGVTRNPRPAREATDTIEELVEALRRIQDEANTVCGDWRETASLIDSICLAALRKIDGAA